MDNLTFIIKTGSQHYVLYQCFGIKIRKHIHNLNIQNYDSRIKAKIEFKKMLNVLHGKDNYSIEFKG